MVPSKLPRPEMPYLSQTEDEVRGALSLLGLSREPLQDSLRQADAIVKAVVRGIHPRNWHGVVAWGETTRYLREQLTVMQVNWQEEPELALPASIVRDGGRSAILAALDLAHEPFELEGYQIVVAGGDARTGDPRRQPRFANLKGHLMVKAVREHGGELPLFRIDNRSTTSDPQLSLGLDGSAIDNKNLSVQGGIATWVFLMRYAEDGVYAELSKPHDITKSGQVKGWSHRIVLGKVIDSSGIVIRSGTLGPLAEYKDDYGMSDDLDLDATAGS